MKHDAVIYALHTTAKNLHFAQCENLFITRNLYDHISAMNIRRTHNLSPVSSRYLAFIHATQTVASQYRWHRFRVFIQQTNVEVMQPRS